MTKTGKIALYSAGGLAAAGLGYWGFTKLRPVSVTAPAAAPSVSTGSVSAPGPTGSTSSASPSATGSATTTAPSTGSAAPVTAPVTTSAAVTAASTTAVARTTASTSASAPATGFAVPSGILASVSGAVAQLQAQELAAAKASYTGNPSTPSPTNPYTPPSVPKGYVAVWIPGYGWSPEKTSNTYLAQVSASLTDNPISGAGTYVDSTGQTGAEMLITAEAQAQYDADARDQSYTLWSIPSSETLTHQAGWLLVPTSTPVTSINAQWTGATEVMEATPQPAAALAAATAGLTAPQSALVSALLGVTVPVDYSGALQVTLPGGQVENVTVNGGVVDGPNGPITLHQSAKAGGQMETVHPIGGSTGSGTIYAAVGNLTAATSGLSTVQRAVADTAIPSGYTGYVHVALPSGQWEDVYVQDGSADGVTLTQTGAAGTVVNGTYVPGGGSS